MPSGRYPERNALERDAEFFPMVTKRMALQDQEEALLLFGPHDKNLKELEHRFGVQIFIRPPAGKLAH